MKIDSVAPPNICRDIQAVKEKFYKDSIFSYLFGSFSKGDQVDGSDIDLIFVYDKAVQPLHEKICYLGQSFDIFIFDVETLNGALHNARLSGEFAIVDAVIEGIPMPEENATAAQLKAIAGRVKKAGYLFKDGIRIRSYVTSLLRDLERDIPQKDKNMLSVELYKSVANILLVAGGAGICSGKKAPRALREINDELFTRLDRALSFAINGSHASLVEISRETLEVLGGALREGFRVNLPDSPRMPLPLC